MTTPFGHPITYETLKAMSKYRKKTITQEDLAREAMRMIQAEDKNISALQHVLNLKDSYGDGVSALCLLYNATGDTLEIVEKKDWDGHVYKEEPPRSFENGQWIAFLHVHPPLPVGTEGARVYRGRNINGQVRDFMIAWSVPWGMRVPNRAYTEVREKNHFPPYWGYIKDNLLSKANQITRDNSDPYCASTVSIGGITSPEFIAVLQHKFCPLPDEM